MEYKKFILEIGPGSDTFVHKRAEENPDALMIALCATEKFSRILRKEFMKKRTKAYPSNLLYDVFPRDNLIGHNINHPERNIRVTIRKKMFDQIHSYRVFMSDDFQEWAGLSPFDFNGYKAKVTEIIKQFIEIIKDNGIIVITGDYNRLLARPYLDPILLPLGRSGFNIHENKDIHSDSINTRRRKETNVCIYASRGNIKERIAYYFPNGSYRIKIEG